MSVIVIEGAGIINAWQDATRHLLQHGDTTNLLVEIADPSIPGFAALRMHNPKRLLPGAKSISDVADTIWPRRMVARSADRHHFYRRYAEVNMRGMRLRRNRSKWGTYCGRLLCFGDSGINQLEDAITKLANWGRQYRAAIVLHLSSSETDRIRVRGGPCLQYLQILGQPNDTLDLVAVYRSQDYSRLALGNFVGLSALLAFICQSANKQPGRLIVHSAFASLGATKTITSRLVAGN